MNNQDNNEIIRFENSLNPDNNNNKKFNDLTNNNQINNNQFQNINNISPNNQSQNPINIQDNNKVDKSNLVSINNQEVVNLNDYKKDDRFTVKSKVETTEEKENKKNTTLTVIIMVVLLLMIFGIIIVANNFLSKNKVDNNNALIFVSNAESFIKDAKSLVKKDTLSSKNLNFAPSCKDETKRETILYLNKILANVNDNKISPFGGEYNLDKSYIKVVAKDKNNSCVFDYYIYLTDNNYSIGTQNNPLISNKINREEVKRNSK